MGLGPVARGPVHTITTIQHGPRKSWDPGTSLIVVIASMRAGQRSHACGRTSVVYANVQIYGLGYSGFWLGFLTMGSGLMHDDYCRSESSSRFFQNLATC